MESAEKIEGNAQAVAIAARAISRAMDWNVRAYGKLAVEEDAEFFARLAIKALEQEYHFIPKF